MNKRRMLTWLTVLLYMVSTLAMTALSEEWEEWSDSSAETATAALNAPEPPPAPDQPPQEPADSTPSEGSGSQAGEQQPNAPADADTQELWQDEPDEWFSQEEGLDPNEEPAVYKVLFITPGGRILLAYQAAAGKAVENPGLSPAMKGYTFSHWYQVGTNPYVSFGFGAPLEGNLTLAALFKPVAAVKPETNSTDPLEQVPAGEEAEEEADPEADPTEENSDPSDLDEDVPGEEGFDEEDPEDGESLPSIQVEITSDAGEMIYVGDTVTLTAHVSDHIAGETFSIWRYNTGGDWVVAATDTLTHSFVVNEDNHGWQWEFRIMIVVGAAD